MIKRGDPGWQPDWLVVMPELGLSRAVIHWGCLLLQGMGKSQEHGSHTPAGYLLSLLF